MAQFRLKPKCFDKATAELLSTKDKGLYPLEVTVAGMKFIEKVKVAVKALFNFDEDFKFNLNSIDQNYINYCLGFNEDVDPPFIDAPSNISETRLVKLINKIVYSIKVRAYRILAPIIVAASGGKSFSLIVNGSVICNKLDIDIISSELKNYLEAWGYNPDVKFEILENNDASLFGSAFISLIYSWKKEKIAN